MHDGVVVVVAVVLLVVEAAAAVIIVVAAVISSSSTSKLGLANLTGEKILFDSLLILNHGKYKLILLTIRRDN